MTVTIPKDVVDLKQFNYESCYPDDLTTAAAPDGTLYDYDIATVKQISETKDSRTLKFSWSEPISKIDYFGGYAVIDEKSITMLDDKYVIMLDDNDYIPILDGGYVTMPNHCLDLVESDQQSPEIHIPTMDEIYDKDCLGNEITLNHTIGIGQINKICKVSYFQLLIQTQDVTSDTILTVDIPYAVLPLVTKENKQNFLLLSEDIEIALNLDKIVTHQYPNYQTFKLNLPANSQYLEFIVSHGASEYIFNHEYNLTMPLLEIENPNNEIEESSCKSDFVSVMKHDYSKSACVTPTTAEKLIKRGWAI